MQEFLFYDHLSAMSKRPDAMAELQGSSAYPSIHGRILFFETNAGVIVAAEVYGLPLQKNECECSVFGFHIHSGGRCSGNDEDPFADALSHFDTHGCSHPCHTGDLPPLFGGRSGHALSIFLTDRFSVFEIIGRTVIIHSSPDDMHTQPSGNSGSKIACGRIVPWRPLEFFPPY